MTSFAISIIVLGIISIIIGQISRKLFYPDFRLPRWLKVVVIVLIFAGTALAAFRFETILEDNRLRSWPQTGAIVTKSEIQGMRAFHPYLEYSYEVDSVTYTGESTLNPPMFGGKRKKHEVAQALVDQYPVGSKIRIHYNPDNISESKLKINPQWNIYAQCGLGYFLVMVGLILVVVPVKKN